MNVDVVNALGKKRADDVEKVCLRCWLVSRSGDSIKKFASRLLRYVRESIIVVAA